MKTENRVRNPKQNIRLIKNTFIRLNIEYKSILYKKKVLDREEG